ncbi:hypothetical protein H5407_21360 [Mitsuaria sp. WAJ17]|uniref:hypothetical protein n=1 Tax=Mitsuaria sp. WAJ17 TaxID=2761452 RepID=UPI0016004E95|nr:hypothetical protein [Mitsuaria sp. WAJ17]MBB2487793.1 hypothetical protein [Mitsuaria sp. WAJ17]
MPVSHTSALHPLPIQAAAFVALGLLSWGLSWHLAGTDPLAELRLRAGRYTLAEAPVLTVRPADETRSRPARVLLALRAPEGTLVEAEVRDVARLPPTALQALLQLPPASPLELRLDARGRVWALSTAGLSVLPEQLLREAALSRRRDSVFGVRFVGSVFLVVSLVLGGVVLLGKRKGAA